MNNIKFLLRPSVILILSGCTPYPDNSTLPCEETTDNEDDDNTILVAALAYTGAKGRGIYTTRG